MTLTFAIDLARRAGAVLREGYGHPRQIDHKGPFDLVTDIDRASEALLVAAITKQYPDHSIVAEEGSNVNNGPAWTWLIDPLDGTNNYAHAFPYFCVSLALLRAGELHLGVVYDPLREELFVAEHGAGATRNGVPIRVSNAPRLRDALLSTGFPYDFATNPANNAAEFTRAHRYVHGIRRAGSAALDLAYVACGRLEAHWELGLKPWDSAAGALLVREAGGQISELAGTPWTPWSGSLIGSNGQIHDELIGVLQADVSV